jgi:phage tail-like protein
MSFQRFLKSAFILLVVVVIAALAGVELRAGAIGPEDPRDAPAISALRGRPPRFAVALQLEDAGISAFFTGISGLGSENEVVEFRDGSDPNVVHKVPGRLKYPDIVQKRGIVADSSLWQWRRLVESGNIADARSNGRITLLDRGSPVATWRFVRGWPAKITGPELSSEGNDIAIEELVIAHEGMLRE